MKLILIIGKYISNTECARFHIPISFPIPFNLIPHVPILKISHQIWKEPFLSFSRYFSPIFYNAWKLWVFCLENFFCFFTNFALEEGLLWTAMWWDFLLIYVRLSDAEKQIWKLNILLQIWAAGLSFIWSRWQKPDLCSHLEVIKRQVILSNRTSLHLQQTVKFLLKNINDCNFFCYNFKFSTHLFRVKL